MTRARSHWTFVWAALLVLLLDQATKIWVRESLLPGQSVPPDGFVRITYITNTGAAFGLFPNQTAFLVVAAVIGVGAILLYYRYPVFDNNFLKISLGLQLGGAIGNLIDRLNYGHVTDFFDLRVWPVFNIADSAIVIGVSILAYTVLFASDRDDRD